MKIAFVYDWVDSNGGAERVLETMHEIWPEAPLFTLVYDQKTARWADVFKIYPSFLQRFPFSKKHHALYSLLMPIAFESFDFTDFDVVISITSAYAKSIITKPKTLHLCYCLTPTRFLWNGNSNSLLDGLRSIDKIYSQRPDQYLAISNTVADRIKRNYQRDAEIIYPPVNLTKFEARNTKYETNPNFQNSKEKYFLIVSRLVPYKRIDIAVEAFNKLGLPLKIIGTGSELMKLKMMAKKNIEFLGYLTDEKVLGYYKECRALIMPQEEDFGLVSLEAQACGKPVIAFGRGGALETIIEGKTGIFFDDQVADSLIKAIEQFNNLTINPKDCREQAEKFSKEIFKKKWIKYLTNIFTS